MIERVLTHETHDVLVADLEEHFHLLNAVPLLAPCAVGIITCTPQATSIAIVSLSRRLISSLHVSQAFKRLAAFWKTRA